MPKGKKYILHSVNLDQFTKYLFRVFKFDWKSEAAESIIISKRVKKLLQASEPCECHENFCPKTIGAYDSIQSYLLERRSCPISIYLTSIFADINECSVTKNGGCSHKCVNTAGGFKCECPDPELSLSSDKKTCDGKHQSYNTSNIVKVKIMLPLVLYPFW